ncbi:MAG TPA: DNA-binding response regulator [Flavobacteriales bacterium]|nr:DNA-binding response regulator [Flavobacteriales bacterium]
MTTNPKILFVEDDENLSYLVGQHLSENKFDATICHDGKKGLKKIKDERFDLCILDVVLPDIDGIELAKEIKKIDRHVPIIFLTSRNLRSDKILGYEVGADDYITKPFDVDIFLLKIKAVLNRSHIKQDHLSDVIQVGNYKLDSVRRCLITENDRIRLSKTESGILLYLIENEGNPVAREEIMKHVWGKSDFFISKSLDVYITRIRKVLREHTSLKLETIHSFGYSLSA